MAGMQSSRVRFAKLKLSTAWAHDARIGYSDKKWGSLYGVQKEIDMAKLQSPSTAPTSEEGKAISCQNSTKHGLTSAKLNKTEEQSLYEEMIASLTEEHNTKGLT